MNGPAQRLHTRKTDTLAQVITETQGAVVERFEEMEASFAAMHERVDEVRRELLVYAGQGYSLIKATLPVENTFWGRLRWLVTGR